MNDLEVLVAGGGIGGITAALCLAKRGHRVHVFEQAQEFGEVGAGVQLSPNGSRVLHDLGLQDALRTQAFLPDGTQFRDWRSGRIIAESVLGDAAVARYGTPYYHIHRGDLLRVLLNAAERFENIALHAGSRVAKFVQRDDGIELSAGDSVHRGDLLIGADGIHSVVRTALWGEDHPRFTGNVAWRAMVPAAEVPAGLVRPMASAWWGPKKHFVHYYVRRGELINCVCVVEKQGWEVESWTERGDHGELKCDFAGWHDDIQVLIDRVDKRSLFKWALLDRAPMAHWSKGRVTLLGDACHPTLPFMAQGAAMAIEDSAVLAACLAKGDNIPASLQHYEHLRRGRTASVQRGSRRNAVMFHLSGFKAKLRDRAVPIAANRTMNSLYRYDALTAAQ